MDALHLLFFLRKYAMCASFTFAMSRSKSFFMPMVGVSFQEGGFVGVDGFADVCAIGGEGQ